jgi:hypothetical protein
MVECRDLTASIARKETNPIKPAMSQLCIHHLKPRHSGLSLETNLSPTPRRRIGRVMLPVACPRDARWDGGVASRCQGEKGNARAMPCISERAPGAHSALAMVACCDAKIRPMVLA